MREMWHAVQAALSIMGGVIGYYIGGFDGLAYALLVFVSLDYITGILCAALEKTLSSEVSFRGIAKKVLIFAFVGIGHIFDDYVIGRGSTMRTAIIFFYMSNEGLSLIENASVLGLPIPQVIKDTLEQIKKKAEEKKETKED